MEYLRDNGSSNLAPHMRNAPGVACRHDTVSSVVSLACSNLDNLDVFRGFKRNMFGMERVVYVKVSDLYCNISVIKISNIDEFWSFSLYVTTTFPFI